MSYNIILLFRETNFYLDVHDFIVKNGLEGYELKIYNFTESIIDKYPDVIYTDETVSEIIRIVYANNANTNCIILDSCVNYLGLNIEELILNTNSYCLLKAGGLSVPIVLNRWVDNHVSPNMIDYSQRDVNVHCTGLIDSLFYTTLNNTINTDKLLFAHMLDLEVDFPHQLTVTRVDVLLFHKILKLYHLETTDNTELAVLLSDSSIDIHMVYLIVRDFIIGRPTDLELVDTLIANYTAYLSRGQLIRVDNIKILLIHDYITDHITNNTLAMPSDMPPWLVTSHRKDARDLYMSLSGRIESCEDPIHLHNNVTLTAKNLLINNTEYLLTSAFTHRNNTIFRISGLNPIKITLFGEPDKVILRHPTNLYHKNTSLLGEFINFNGILYGLMGGYNSYCVLLLDNKDFCVKGVSQNFTLPKNYRALGLCKNDGTIGVFMKSKKQVYKMVLNQKQLLLNILPHMVTNKSPFKIKIQYKNSIGVNISGYTIEEKLHNKYNFYNLPSDNTIFSTIEMSVNSLLMEIDNKLMYINEFIYLPPSPTFSPTKKTAEVYFHPSAKTTKLYKKVQELGILTSDDYTVAKYLVINQDAFENLNMKEVSDIISNHCLIISLIDETLLKQNKLKSKYTANESLIKLFLFNIVKNSRYVDFIFSKIIHSNEYQQRSEFMNVDIASIDKENNIYDYILKHARSKKSHEITLSDKGANLLSIIKSKVLNGLPERGYKNMEILVKFIIKYNFNTEIAFINMNPTDIESAGWGHILQLLKTVNWLGCVELNIAKNSKTRYNIYIFKSRRDIEDLVFETSTLIYILESDDLLLV